MTVMAVSMPTHLDDSAQWIQTWRRRWEGRLDRLEGYLARNKGEPR